ncbi:MAG: FKBP-type peptidyl-prolyl cis-trans isomerase [Pseudoclavibacter sp.]|nr:FKBP-type peptidyl-prolyl cis-trans isomerase [Pseudoclavibacter sp.]
MRLRTFPARRVLALAAATVAALALSACGPAAEQSDAEQPAPTLEGAFSSFHVDGAFGEAPVVSLGNLDDYSGELDSTTVIAGEGKPVTDEEPLVLKVAAWSMADGAEFMPYGWIGDTLDLASSTQLPFLKDVLSGKPAGSRMAVLMPGWYLPQAQGQQATYDRNKPVFLVMDVERVERTSAWGAVQPATQSMVTVTDGEGGEPQIVVDSSQPAPTELVLDVRKRGDGQEVAEGDDVLLQYSGVLYADGQPFDSSWSRGKPAAFATDQVVPGFTRSLVGQRVGSQVIAVIPPDLAYGAEGSGGVPPNATLVFVIDVLDVI